MSKMSSWFLEERAERLAEIYLTRRDDLTVIRQPRPIGTDMLVSIQRNGRDIGRYFGVMLKGFAKPVDGFQWDSKWIDVASLQDVSFPVCLFVFVMEGDQGYWKWIQQPAVQNGQSALTFSPDAALRHLDNTEPQKTEELTSIVDAVNAWYDSRRTLAAA